MYICIDIGGTAIKYGLADSTGTFSEKGSMPTEALRSGGPGIVKKVRHLIQSYRTSQPVDGVAISTAGMVDPEAGTVFYALPEAIPDYTGTAWKTNIEDEFHIPCAVENDVNCAALGEMWLGAGKGYTSLFCMTVGTSIGGAVICDGRIWHGACNSAGEIAYMQIPGGRMHEQVSAVRLVRDVAAAKGLAPDTVDGKQIFSWAKAGDADAVQAIDALIRPLADGMANVAAVLNPQIIVLGGGIMAQEAYLRPRLEAALAARLVPAVYAHTRVAFAQQKNDAGMLGALYHLLQCAGQEAGR